MRRSVRCLLSLILIIAFMFSLVGCGEKPAAKEGEAKEELVIALDRYSAGKKPPEGLGVSECTQIYEPLLFLNHKLEIKPGLVTSWKRVDDLNWSLKLREGVKFHNGKTRIVIMTDMWIKTARTWILNSFFGLKTNGIRVSLKLLHQT